MSDHNVSVTGADDGDEVTVEVQGKGKIPMSREEADSLLDSLMVYLGRVPPTPPADLLAVVVLREWAEAGWNDCRNSLGLTDTRTAIWQAVIDKLDTLTPQRVREVEGVVVGTASDPSIIAVDGERLNPGTPVKVLIEVKP